MNFKLMCMTWATLCLTFEVFGQLSTKNNYTGSWSDASSWSTAQPDPLTAGLDDECDIYGYITRDGSLSFDNLGTNTKQFVVYDTLVVKGSMTFANNSMSLVVETGGLLVVFGNFEANNKVDLENGGTMVVTGDMALNGGNQEYVNNGGGLYVDGNITGNGDTAGADAVDQPSSNLNGSGDAGQQSLYNFIAAGGTTALPITLGSFEGESIDKIVKLEWVTLTEENFEFFEIQRSLDGQVFDVIGEVQGQGFSSTKTAYSFEDLKPYFGTVYYRLNAVDYDGSSELFHVIAIEHKPIGLEPKVYPNPSQGQAVTLLVNVDENVNNTRVSVTNYEGRVVYETSEVGALKLRNLESGLYFVKVRIDNLVYHKKLLIQ